MSLTLPTFLIVGAAKSGTSSLWHYLREHPEVYVPKRKEVDFFNDDDRFALGAAWYADFFARGAGKKALGEASPSYLFSEVAGSRMAEIVPSARLVMILRNPIDRAYSHFLHARYYTLEQRSFREVVEEERAAPEGRRWPYYLAQSRYLPQLQRLMKSFPREQALILLLDDLIAEPVSMFKTLCEHVRIDPSIVPSIVGDATNTYRESRAAPLMRRLITPMMGNRVPWLIRRPFLRLTTRSGRTPPPIDPGIRRELAEYFAQDNED
ncbi:MAG: sulfotransferase, partial [Actinomycetota bacterium]